MIWLMYDHKSSASICNLGLRWQASLGGQLWHLAIGQVAGSNFFRNQADLSGTAFTDQLGHDPPLSWLPDSSFIHIQRVLIGRSWSNQCTEWVFHGFCSMAMVSMGFCTFSDFLGCSPWLSPKWWQKTLRRCRSRPLPRSRTSSWAIGASRVVLAPWWHGRLQKWWPSKEFIRNGDAKHAKLLTLNPLVTKIAGTSWDL